LRYPAHVCGNGRCFFGEVCGIHQYAVLKDACDFEYSRTGTYTYHGDLKV